MRRRIIIECIVFSLLWIVFVFFFLFPEAKKYMEIKKLGYSVSSQGKFSNKLRLEGEIEVLKKYQEFFRKNLFPLQEVIVAKKNIRGILKKIEVEGNKYNIKTKEIKVEKGEPLADEVKKLSSVSVQIDLECSYRKFLKYLNVLAQSPFAYRITRIKIEKKDETNNLNISVNFNTICL